MNLIRHIADLDGGRTDGNTSKCDGAFIDRICRLPRHRTAKRIGVGVRPLTSIKCAIVEIEFCCPSARSSPPVIIIVIQVIAAIFQVTAIPRPLSRAINIAPIRVAAQILTITVFDIICFASFYCCHLSLCRFTIYLLTINRNLRNRLIIGADLVSQINIFHRLRMRPVNRDRHIHRTRVSDRQSRRISSLIIHRCGDLRRTGSDSLCNNRRAGNSTSLVRIAGDLQLDHASRINRPSGLGIAGNRQFRHSASAQYRRCS